MQRTPVDYSDLLTEINDMKEMIQNFMVRTKTQQTRTVNDNENSYINMFLQNKCHNAYDIKKFVDGIDFSKEDFDKLTMDYVGVNADIILRNYNKLPAYERPIYVFTGEEEHQTVSLIRYDGKWVIERELEWVRDVRRNNEESVVPVLNSMFSLIRLFDKKKMEYYDEKYIDNYLYLSKKKFLEKDCRDHKKQLKLIYNIIDMVSIEL